MKEKTKTILGWILGIAFLFAFLGILTSGQYFQSIIFLVIALFLLPPVNNFLKEKNFNISTGIKIVIVIGLIIVFIIYSANTQEKRITNSQNNQMQNNLNTIQNNIQTETSNSKNTSFFKTYSFSEVSEIKDMYLNFRFFTSKNPSNLASDTLNKLNESFFIVYVERVSKNGLLPMDAEIAALGDDMLIFDSQTGDVYDWKDVANRYKDYRSDIGFESTDDSGTIVERFMFDNNVSYINRDVYVVYFKEQPRPIKNIDEIKTEKIVYKINPYELKNGIKTTG